MTDFAHIGNENVAGCEQICSQDPDCSCFIHTNRPDPSGGFASCKTLNHSVMNLPTTARGYSAWVKSTS
jgi:hypothetical protein